MFDTSEVSSIDEPNLMVRSTFLVSAAQSKLLGPEKAGFPPINMRVAISPASTALANLEISEDSSAGSSVYLTVFR